MESELLQKYKKGLSEAPDVERKKELGFYMQWHITDSCNLRCKHCYSPDRSVRDLPLKKLKEIFDKYLKVIRKWNIVGSLSLTGGEPMMRDDFFALLDYMYEKWEEHHNFVAYLMSNGTLMNEDFVSQLRSYQSMLPLVQVSLDGVTEKTHDFVRGRGSYIKTKNAFHLLHENGFRTALHFVVHKSNYKDAFHLMELAEKVKVTRVTLSRLVPEGRGGILEMLSPAELKELWTYLSDTCVEYYKKGIYLVRVRCDLWHLVDMPSTFYALQQGQKGSIPSYLRVGQRCAAGILALTVDADGTAYPCRRLPIPVGNVAEDTLFKVWYTSKLLWKLRYRQRHMKGKCEVCPFVTDSVLKDLCAGGAPCISYSVSGDIFEPDSQCWFDPHATEQKAEVEKWKKRMLKQEKTSSS